ncbi:PLAC8-domain-containing protein [Pluteus cervinus]|uniref:PLAC8-domain-containing protein n=1 Tax=Pluteus cervinus TaxID=181527 RepID=A0ACD3B001_9AGAR|nr:PLAC8-domain-containing protein [Pluteus cervinus]
MAIPAGPPAGPGGNRNSKNLPYEQDGRAWSEGLFGCCSEPGTCVKSWFCPCVQFAQNKQRVEYLEDQGAFDPDHGGGFFSGDCFLHCLLQGCLGGGWILQIGERGTVRNRYRIKGGAFSDCCTIYWCNPCALTQESRELELEEASLGWKK